MASPWTRSIPEPGEILISLPLRDRKRALVYVLAAAVSLPLGYSVFSWSVKTYSFLALYKPEQIFRESDGSTDPLEHKGTEILEALNAEIQQESHIKQSQESWLLARLDRLWYSVREYVSPSGEREPSVTASKRPVGFEDKVLAHPFPGQLKPAEPARAEEKQGILYDVLSLATDPKVIQSVSEDPGKDPGASRKAYQSLMPAPAESPGHAHQDEELPAAEWLYRFESLKGNRTQSVIYQFNRNLSLEGTVEAKPMGETDPDLSDFGFRTVHALSFLRDRPAPSVMMGYEGVSSGYPISYGIGLNYKLSRLFNLRFDYSHETPNDSLVEYNGTWESSLMTSYDKHRLEDPLAIHSFFLGLRYLHRQKTTLFPLHTGFFYSTNMDDEPLDSNVSLGFSIGAGINRRDLRLGFAWRFRIWDNPEDQFLKEQEMKELDTKVSNQFLITLVF